MHFLCTSDPWVKRSKISKKKKKVKVKKEKEKKVKKAKKKKKKSSKSSGSDVDEDFDKNFDKVLIDRGLKDNTGKRQAVTTTVVSKITLVSVRLAVTTTAVSRMTLLKIGQSQLLACTWLLCPCRC